ncbi:MAG: hypothetical protein E7351_02270 [Clostridiales bacterium]|nr:hypothetical protein [Clostridiales bacterium]
MKVSQIGLISRKLAKLDEQFPVQDMLLQTGQLEQFTSGVYAYGHIPFLVEKKINEIISKTLTKYGCSELSLPILQPEKIWIESGRLDKYVSDGVMFQSLTKNGNYCLAPTAEEAIVTYAKSRLTTYKQLPVTYFQIGQKFRNEIRTRGFLLRGKAFDMMDAYSFGKDKADLDIEYDRMKNAYIEIFEELGLKVQPVGADSGAIGGSKSEEFMCLSEIGEDTILFDEESGRAFNSELLEREDYKEYLLENYGIKNTDSLQQRRAVELGHIFQLGDKYSKAMNATYSNADGKLYNYVMGCYGIGVSRTLAMVYENSIIMNNGKFDGIALPVNLAPYKLYIIPKTDDEAKMLIAQKMYQELQEKGVECLYDDRAEMSIGAKIKDSRVVGAPYTVVFGKSLDNNVLEIENNKTGEKQEVSLDEFVSYVCSLNKN